MYIAYRANSAMIARQMDLERAFSVRIGPITAYNYWQGNDFDQIEACIHEIFAKLGWLP